MLVRLRATAASLLGQGGSLSKQMARGSLWVFVSYGLQQVITLARSMILARLLTPADFGLMGLASLSTAALLVFTETGVYVALLQCKTMDSETEDTAWVVMASRGILLSVALFALAPLFADFFAQSRLTTILRVLAWTFLLSGFNSLSVIQLQREMRFDRLAYFSVSLAVLSLVVWVAAAMLFRNVWALVTGEIVGAVATLVLTYRLTDFRPRLRLSWAKMRELVNFGKYLTGSSIITYLSTQGDDAVVGKLLGPQVLGYYGVAYRASNLPATSISHVINRVTIPGFARLQDDISQLRAMYLRTLRLTALLIFPFAGGMFAVANYFVPVFYGNQWLPAIPAFMVLCFFGLERAIGSVVGPVFLALGRTRLLMMVNLSKLVTMAALIVPLTLRYDIVGTSMAVTISAVVVHSVVLVVSARLLDTSAVTILRQLAKPAIVTALMAAVVLGVQNSFSWPVNVGSLLALSAMGSAIYVPIIVFLERRLISGLARRVTVAGST